MSWTLVVGSGRCGSMYLAELLRANGLDAAHEPEPCLRDSHERAARGDPIRSVSALEARPVADVEVNPYGSLLVEHLLAYASEPPNRVVHLHRDGKEAIASQLRNARPGAMDPYKREGDTRFEAACRWWARSVAHGHAHASVSLRFEDLVKDPKLACAAFGIQDRVRDPGPVNQTAEKKRSRFPAPEDWSLWMNQRYKEICGPAETMVRGQVVPCP